MGNFNISRMARRSSLMGENEIVLWPILIKSNFLVLVCFPFMRESKVQ